MSHGKITCEALKAIRKKIAEQNGIKYEPVTCNHKGDCSGTCPMCEMELKYLENQIQRKKSSGKNIAILGIAAGLGLLTPQLSAAQLVEPSTQTEKTAAAEKVKVTGIIKDKDGCELPGVFIAEMINDSIVNQEINDIDGRFEIYITKGATLRFGHSYKSYKTQKIEIAESKNLEIVLENEDAIYEGVIVIPPPRKKREIERVQRRETRARKREIKKKR